MMENILSGRTNLRVKAEGTRTLKIPHWNNTQTTHNHANSFNKGLRSSTNRSVHAAWAYKPAKMQSYWIKCDTNLQQTTWACTTVRKVGDE